MSTARRAANWLVRRVRQDPGYTIHPDLDGRDVAAEVTRRGVSAVRAVWSLRGVRGGRLRFCENGVQVRHRRHLSIGSGSVVEAYTRLHCLSERGFRIGRRVTIGKFAILEAGGVLWNRGVGLRIGDGSSVGDYCFVGASGGVWIGDRVLMGQRVSIHSQNHAFDDLDRPIQAQGVTQAGVRIEDDCWLGSGSVILDGVTLGRGCVVSAGSVVTRSFPPGSVVAGVPARLLRTRGGGAADA
ncbi:acyltransferase [Aquipuribacter sp. SD81]|uniref:acyltransferase n=1 Tax=Aquipuribacter sp. SD81 TaxID=3127703 RepID=UPI003017CC63